MHRRSRIDLRHVLAHLSKVHLPQVPLQASIARVQASPHSSTSGISRTYHAGVAGKPFIYVKVLTQCLPNIFSENFPLITSTFFIFITYLAQIPGYFTAGFLVEKIGRRYVIFTFMLFTGLSAYLFITNLFTLSLIGAFLLSFFDLGAWGALYAITPELYPKNIKGTGAGLAITLSIALLASSTALAAFSATAAAADV